MKRDYKGRNPRKWMIMLLTVIVAAGLAWGLVDEDGFLRGQSRNVPPRAERSLVFTPAHSNFLEAAKHFFGLRSEPQQPIAYQHKPHIEKALLQCDFCHASVAQSPVAGIPGVKTCMICHEFIATEKPEIQKLTEFYKRGEDIPWQRVYGWSEEAHVRFNHAPHIRAEIECATCHGDVAQMTVARRVVDHTMGFCVNCHKLRQASNDCWTCHY